MDKLAIIDGDALTYHSSKDSIHESIEIIDEKIQNIFTQTEATHYVLFISNSPYFRHKISPDYKSNRNKYKSTLKWLKTLKNYLKEEWGAQSMDLVEADDLCAYWMNKDLCIADDGKIEPREVFQDALDYCVQMKLPTFSFESMDKVLCAVDKDLLQSIPSKHYNYTYKLEDKNDPNSIVKGWWVETSEAESDDFKRMQVVVGDITDGISGLKGKGIKFYEKISKEIKPSFGELLQLYCVEYGQAQGIFEFQKNYRLLHLLSTDEDFEREIGQLPELPEIREVTLNSQIEKLDDDLTF